MFVPPIVDDEFSEGQVTSIFICKYNLAYCKTFIHTTQHILNEILFLLKYSLCQVGIRLDCNKLCYAIGILYSNIVL